MEDGLINFMGYMWLQVEGQTITVGVNEEGLEDLDKIVSIDLPAENDQVVADEICGELDSRDGPLNIYSPVDGTVKEIKVAKGDIVEEDDVLIIIE